MESTFIYLSSFWKWWFMEMKLTFSTLSYMGAPARLAQKWFRKGWYSMFVFIIYVTAHITYSFCSFAGNLLYSGPKHSSGISFICNLLKRNILCKKMFIISCFTKDLIFCVSMCSVPIRANYIQFCSYNNSLFYTFNK